MKILITIKIIEKEKNILANIKENYKQFEIGRTIFDSLVTKQLCSLLYVNNLQIKITVDMTCVHALHSNLI